MTDPYLVVTSQGGTIQSNEISSTGIGVEVKPGLTGLGLPPVELQFDKSAGDGARYRGRRVQQRNLDLAFHVHGPDRDALKPHLDRIAMVLAYPCTMTWEDPDAEESWTIVGYRTGGGDYAVGVDSDGETYANLEVTLTTETPYWESTAEVVATSTMSRSISLANAGTKSSAPVWEITGPSLGFKAESEAGEILQFNGLIDASHKVTIDCGTGTVTDNNGINRYNDLASTPRFFQIPEGDSSVAVTLDQLSTDYGDAFSAPRKNHVSNPAFNTGTTGWTLIGYEYDATNDRLAQDASEVLIIRPMAYISLTGLTVGKNYVARVAGASTSGTYGPQSTKRLADITIIDSGVYKTMTADAAGGFTNPFEFTAEATTVLLRVRPECAVKKDGTFARSTGWIDTAYVGEPGPYFDGNTIDTPGMTYAWAGTVNASVSTATPTSLPTAGSSVRLSFKPRKWLVI